MRISKAEFQKQITSFFIKETGLSIPAAKKKIKEQMKIDEYNNIIKSGNVKIFYTNNENYCQGIKNGYGAGWYISNVGFKGGSEFKI